jgi:hypothetical protein
MILSYGFRRRLIPEAPATIVSSQQQPFTRVPTMQTGFIVALAALAFLSWAAPQARHTATPPTAAPSQEKIVTTRATGTFDVTLAPQTTDTPAEGSPLGRLTIDKQFHGHLEGTSKGEMLTAGSTTIENSAGYVAVERVTGTLHGKKGTFALQHNGIMTRGEGKLTITVVPDSGTGELTGLSGSMSIDIANGKHSYTLDYTLP